MKSLLTFNIREDRVFDKPKLLDQMRRLNPQWALVVNSQPLAQQLLSVVSHVIDRRTHLAHIHDEGDLSTRYRPEEYVDVLLQQCTDPRLVLHVNNEPNVGTVADMFRLTTWLATVVGILCSPRYRRRVVVGNFPPASEESDWIRQGAYDPLIHTLNRHRGKAWYGAHAYTPYLLPLGAGTISHHDAWNPEAVHPSKWPRIDQINPKATWHYPRFNWVVDVRARQLGYQPLPTVVTEFGIERMWDLPPTLYAEMDAKFPASDYHQLDGTFSLRHYWKSVLGVDYVEALRLQLEWVISITRNFKHVEALCLWEYGEPRDEKNWAMHDAAVEMVIALQDTVSPIAIDVPTTPVVQYPAYSFNDMRWKKVRVSAKSQKGANIRPIPNTTRPEVGMIPHTGMEASIIEEYYEERVGKKVYQWMPIRFGDKMGWVRSDVVTLYNK